MFNVLNITDVVGIGIEKEKARRDFYNQVSQKFNDQEMKDLFSRLRDWEDAHIKKFQEIRSNLKEPDTVESYPGELSSYMQSLVDDKLYSDVTPEKFNANVKTSLEAIQYGIQFEKDAVLLFVELASYVHSSNKDIIMKLMDEERKHIVYLMKLRKKFE